MSPKPTRHSAKTGIFYARLMPYHWQHIDKRRRPPEPTGPKYKTERDLLADHDRFLTAHR
jgi:hypothetical protein